MVSKDFFFAGVFTVAKNNIPAIRCYPNLDQDAVAEIRASSRHLSDLPSAFGISAIRHSPFANIPTSLP
jgi:hypothetical protein